MSKIYNESEEMYLETILILREEKTSVRAIDISNRMGFSRASVSRAVQNLKNKGYIDVLENDAIILLKKGEEYANNVYEKHRLLAEFLEKIGVKDKIAEEDACKIEHVISEETVQAIKNFLNK